MKGIYRGTFTVLRPDKNKEGVLDRYKMEITLSETVSGNEGTGRKLWRTYYKDNQESVQNMVNDLFTSGITLDTTSEAAFEGSFENAIGKPVVVRCYGWTKEKDKDGNVVPKEERETVQMFVIKSASDKDVKGGGAKKGSAVPF